MSLVEIGNTTTRQLQQFAGLPWNDETERKVLAVVQEYCREVWEIYGIRMLPIIRWRDDHGQVEADAKPYPGLDEAMWDRLLEKEGVKPA